MQESELIHDWNCVEGCFDYSTRKGVQLNDETLRDGLQSPSVTDPPIEDKLRLLHLMNDLGIASADIGLPGAGPRAVRDVEALAREIADNRLSIEPNCAARTVRADVQPIIDVSQRVGIAIEAATFIGSSPIRQYAEDWTLERMLKATEDAVGFAVKHDLPVMYVTEDTTRARPEVLKKLYTTAIECGARRICLADTVGHATPHGVRQLVRFIRTEIVEPSGEDVKIDWHGHRDRGLAVPNCLAAIEEGATGGASNYFDTVCPDVASATKLSVQLDWLRHWWDYHTNATESDPGMRPSFARMIEELDAAPLWSAGTAWTRMRSGVESRSGAEQLARWDQMGAWNGID